MREDGLWVEVVDVGAAHATGLATIDELYLKVHLLSALPSFSPFFQIIGAFTCFVYVQGLPTIADLFLKWCCEVLPPTILNETDSFFSTHNVALGGLFFLKTPIARTTFQRTEMGATIVYLCTRV
jgi:hypothetical protein